MGAAACIARVPPLDVDVGDGRVRRRPPPNFSEAFLSTHRLVTTGGLENSAWPHRQFAFTAIS